jgi:small subunit ribosomal protein S16
VAVKIKLKRIGKMRDPHYRIVVADARTKRNGRAIEEIGQYHPVVNPSHIVVNSPRAQYWLGVGAQPTEAVAAIFKVTGDWQKFKGEPAPPPMLVAAPKPDKRAVYAEAMKEAKDEPSAAATTPKAKKSASKPPAKAAPADKSAAPSADEPVDKTADTTAQKPADKSADTAAPKPADKPAEPATESAPDAASAAAATAVPDAPADAEAAGTTEA